MKSTTETTRRQRRGHGRPTLHDVADAAGVTRITVSRFMRQPELVAESTAARIREAIEQTGYVPNQQAGQLASGNSRIVAALIPNVGHSIFAETIQGLTEGLHGSGHELLLLSTGYSMEREEAQLRALTGWAPGAIIVTGRHHSPGALRMLRDAQAAGTPVVEIWDHPTNRADSEGFAQIGFDHVAAGRTMARHLIDKGHVSLAYIDSGVGEDFRAHERGQGFMAEAKAQGVRVKVLRASTGDAFDAGREMVPLLLAASRTPITAVAFANDHLACGVDGGDQPGSSDTRTTGLAGFWRFSDRPAVAAIALNRAATDCRHRPCRREGGLAIGHKRNRADQSLTALPTDWKGQYRYDAIARRRPANLRVAPWSSSRPCKRLLDHCAGGAGRGGGHSQRRAVAGDRQFGHDRRGVL
ncbi:LacI family DNA-binding transcriptional regulator [Polaromonas sp. P1-6]|nr:LacI family DNA-binding transcriptional regulator [Polaromonas sp. P1-6]